MWFPKENGTVPCFIGVCNPDRIIGNVDHAGVFNFVNGVAADVGHLSTLGDQHNVVALEETHKTCQGKNIIITIILIVTESCASPLRTIFQSDIYLSQKFPQKWSHINGYPHQKACNNTNLRHKFSKIWTYKNKGGVGFTAVVFTAMDGDRISILHWF